MPTLRSKYMVLVQVREGEQEALSTTTTSLTQEFLCPESQQTRSCVQTSESHTESDSVKAQCHENEFMDGCLTDPEPGMDSRRATVRNVRSKCRCSCVLQFTFRRAVSCVLHRPPSQVIHCTVLSFFQSLEKINSPKILKSKQKITSL